jgi:hypothetical protein
MGIVRHVTPLPVFFPDHCMYCRKWYIENEQAHQDVTQCGTLRQCDRLSHMDFWDCFSLALHLLLYQKPTSLWSSRIRYLRYSESLAQWLVYESESVSFLHCMAQLPFLSCSCHPHHHFISKPCITAQISFQWWLKFMQQYILSCRGICEQ